MLINRIDYPEQAFEVLSEARKLELMIIWFQERYEDPVHATSYDGREGGFQFLGGVPYNARNVLTDTFDDLVTQETLDLAVEFIEKDGLFQWVPINRGDDRDIEQPFDEGSFADSAFASSSSDFRSVERSARAALQEELAEARRQLDSLRQAHPRNHNKPPEEIEVDGEAAAQIAKITISIDRLEIYTGQQQPDVVKVAKEVFSLRSVLMWFGERATAYVDGLAPAITVVYANSPEKINAIATGLYNAAEHWIVALLHMSP